MNSLHVHDGVTWTTQIVAYTKHMGMVRKPLNVCGMGTYTTNKDFHNDVVMKGFDTGSFINNILVDQVVHCYNIQ